MGAINVRLEDDLKQKLDTYCKDNGISRNQLVRKLILERLVCEELEANYELSRKENVPWERASINDEP